MGQNIGLGAVVHLVERRAQVGDRRRDRPTVDPRNDVGQHGPPEQVVGPDRVVAEPIELQDARTAEALARMQDGVEVLLMHGDAQPVRRRRLDEPPPLAGPADGRDDAAPAVLDVEEGRVGRGTAVFGPEFVLGAGGKRPIERLPIVVGAPAALQPVPDRGRRRVPA